MKKFLIFIISLILILPMLSLAARQASDCSEYCSSLSGDDPFQSPANQVCICNPLSTDKFEDIIDNLINFIFNIAIVLTPLMVIVGGFLFVTAAGNVKQIDQAKKLILYTVIGFLVVLLSKGIVVIINQILGVSSI